MASAQSPPVGAYRTRAATRSSRIGTTASAVVPKVEPSGEHVPKAEPSVGLIPKVEPSAGGVVPKEEPSGGVVLKDEPSDENAYVIPPASDESWATYSPQYARGPPTRHLPRYVTGTDRVPVPQTRLVHPLNLGRTAIRALFAYAAKPEEVGVNLDHLVRDKPSITRTIHHGDLTVDQIGLEEFRAIIINVQWPTYPEILQEEIVVYRLGKFITVGSLVYDIVYKIFMYIERLGCIPSTPRTNEWAVSVQRIQFQDIVLLGITQLHGRVFRVGLDVWR